MKKIFTLAAAVLASIALFAQTTNEGTYSTQVISSDGTTSTWTFIAPGSQVNIPAEGAEDVGIVYAPSASGKMKFSSSNQFSWQGESSGYIPVPADGAGTITMVVKSSSDSRWLQLYVNGTAADESKRLWSKYAEAAGDGKKGPQSFAFTAADLTTKDGKTYLHFKDNNNKEMKITSFEVALTNGLYGVPSTDPVSSVEVQGPNEGYTDYEAEFKAVANAGGAEYKWYVNDVEVDGATAATLKYTPTAEGVYTIAVKARNQYNEAGVWVASEPRTFQVQNKTLLPQMTVTEYTVWDWTKAASVSEIKWTDATNPAKGDTVLLANVDGMNNNANFNGQALMFSGEYPVRDGKYCQGDLISFQAEKDGYVQVVFSNTGNSTAEKPRPKRYVAINGEVWTAVGSDQAKAVNTGNIPVKAGEVKIEGSFEAYEAQYLRIYTIIYGVGELPTAIENTNAAVKATKVIRDGQIFILKGDKLYNALGAEVK